jgi:hypothetical protein
MPGFYRILYFFYYYNYYILSSIFKRYNKYNQLFIIIKNKDDKISVN